MKVEEIKVGDKIVYNLIFEDEDSKLYNDLLGIAETKNITVQELVNEILSEACLN